MAFIRVMPRGERTASPQQQARLERSGNTNNTVNTASPNKTLSPEQRQRQKQNVLSRKETVLGIKGCVSKLRHNSSKINKETIYHCLKTRDEPLNCTLLQGTTPMPGEGLEEYLN